MKVKDVMAELSKAGPDTVVAYSSRWADSGRPLQHTLEVVQHIATCSVPYKGEGETEERRVRVVVLNPCMRALDNLATPEPAPRAKWTYRAADRAPMPTTLDDIPLPDDMGIGDMVIIDWPKSVAHSDDDESFETRRGDKTYLVTFPAVVHPAYARRLT
jgi:hypothetical protein